MAVGQVRMAPTQRTTQPIWSTLACSQHRRSRRINADQEAAVAAGNAAHDHHAAV